MNDTEPTSPTLTRNIPSHGPSIGIDPTEQMNDSLKQQLADMRQDMRQRSNEILDRAGDFIDYREAGGQKLMLRQQVAQYFYEQAVQHVLTLTSLAERSNIPLTQLEGVLTRGDSINLDMVSDLMLAMGAELKFTSHTHTPPLPQDPFVQPSWDLHQVIY